MKLLQLIIVSWLTIFATGKAIEFGSIWDGRVHPMRDVEVVLKDQRRYVGELSREWGGSYVITTADGRSAVFGRDDFLMMAGKPSFGSEGAFSMLKHWRSFVLVQLLFAAYLGFLFFWWRGQRGATSAGS